MTDLSSLLDELPEEKVRELERITQTIVATGLAEMVILFGSYARGDYKRSHEKGKRSDFDLLIITRNQELTRQLKQQLYNGFEGVDTPVQKVIEDIYRVNRDLREGHYFFTDIIKEGKILFTSGNLELEEAKELSKERRKEIAEEDFKNWYGKGLGFMRMYQHSLDDKLFQIAAFNLQQVAEMCYTTIEMVYNQYNPHQHDLIELRKRIKTFDPRFDEPFPRTTQEQKDSFDYLNFAYIGGRYRSEKDFPVTKAQLEYWSEEARKLLELTKEICGKWIELM